MQRVQRGSTTRLPPVSQRDVLREDALVTNDSALIQPTPLIAASYPHNPQEVEYRYCPVAKRLVLVFRSK